MQVQCKQCSVRFDKVLSQIKKTKNNFCSKSCAAKHNNVGTTRNKPKERRCQNCQKNFFVSTSHTKDTHRSRKYCPLCFPLSKKSSFYKTRTLKEYYNLLSVANKHPSWRAAHIRGFNRSWNKNLTKLPCQICEYKKHVNLCHIKDISSFPEETTLGVINDPLNIYVLCKNHHWEFDNNCLEEPIKSR